MITELASRLKQGGTSQHLPRPAQGGTRLALASSGFPLKRSFSTYSMAFTSWLVVRSTCRNRQLCASMARAATYTSRERLSAPARGVWLLCSPGNLSRVPGWMPNPGRVCLPWNEAALEWTCISLLDKGLTFLTCSASSMEKLFAMSVRDWPVSGLNSGTSCTCKGCTTGPFPVCVCPHVWPESCTAHMMPSLGLLLSATHCWLEGMLVEADPSIVAVLPQQQASAQLAEAHT